MRGKRFSGLRGILPGFALSLGLSFLLCIYAPFELYLTNREEFWFRASQMLPYTLGLFFAALLVLCLSPVPPFSLSCCLRYIFRGRSWLPDCPEWTVPGST